ncbi:MAG TPA: T9SS type A sorting domain-containing protein [Saprospiraceae bacterium]|nr:T9SS type A sorting domain-containing protein [Saprospiraceae bacterium]
MKKYILVLMNLFFYSIHLYAQFKGTLKNIEYKNNKITIEYNTNQDGSLCNGCNIACKGEYTNTLQFTATKADHNSNGYASFFLFPENAILKSNSYEFIHGFSNSTDTLLSPYVCITQDTTTYCYHDDGLPTIEDSYLDANNFYHYIGYIGGNKGNCYYLPAYKLRYTKYSSRGYYPDSLLQYYDIETYDPNNKNTFTGFQASIMPTKDNQQLIIYSTPDTNFNQYGFTKPTGFRIIKLDTNLHQTYSENIFSSYYSDTTYLNITVTNRKSTPGKIFIGGYAGYYINYSGDSSYYFLVECDSNGIVLHETLSSNISILDSVRIVNKEYSIFTTDTSTCITYYNANGDSINSVLFNQRLIHNFVKTKDNKYLFVSLNQNGNGNYDTYISVYNSVGRLIKHQLFIQYFLNEYAYNTVSLLGLDSFNNIMFFANEPSYECGMACGGVFQNIIYSSTNLESLNYVNGKIITDINRNCEENTDEIGAKNILVELKLNTKKYFTLSDDSGKYKFTPYDTGHGKVILHLENQSTYTNACQDTFDVYISDTSQNLEINFLVQTPSCGHPTPKLNVEISTPFLRRCFDNNYTLTVFNESSDTAFNSYVDIELDEHLIATDTAFSSAQNLGNNSYRFYIGNVPPLQTIRKQLKIKVDCDSTILGQTHCVKATAFPYEFCNIIDAKYMQAHTACRNDSVIFTIKNIGYPKNFQQYFRIIENDTITYNGILSFTQSISQNSLTYYNPTGKTYRLETRQYPMYVNEDTILSVTIEGCGNPNFSTGYVNLFSQDDDAPNVDIDCHQNVGSFDPNEKTAQPNGFGDSLYILPNTPIEYTIHFQNKGTFAASYITITDTLSAFFDITTFQMLSSSHPFTYAIIDSNILQFTSTSINLPAEQDDTLGSNGYIKFKISPKKNIPTATTIKNTASIIFDFNTPIITNTVIRNVTDDFLKVKIISSVKNNLTKIKTTIYPNPFNQTATLSFDYQQPTQLTIFSIDGKIMQQYQSTDNFYTIDRKQLSKGMYLYELKKISNNELLDTGKLVIQ